nr:PREDICTED: taste receptor type 2 member 39-like [Latimeria chalumnae]|eukprot:XP_014350892.1 PREDICTED: taste receptor type 2 member 39-like [Latimeria chalumnae]
MDKNSTSSNSSHTDALMVIATMLICLIALFIDCAGTTLPVNMQIASGRFDAVIAVSLMQLIYSAGSSVILIIGMINLFIWFVVYLFDLCINFGEVFYKVTDFVAIFLSSSSYWFITWLCFIYFVKIVKIKSRFFIGLKQKMSSLVIVLILFTLLVSFSVALPGIYTVKLKTNSTSISELCKDYYVIGEFGYIYGAFLNILTSFLPLVIMLISSIGIVIFL